MAERNKDENSDDDEDEEDDNEVSSNDDDSVYSMTAIQQEIKIETMSAQMKSNRIFPPCKEQLMRCTNP